jgi:hypothetical protein
MGASSAATTHVTTPHVAEKVATKASVTPSERASRDGRLREHGQRHPERSGHEQRPPAEAVDEQKGWRAREEVDDADEGQRGQLLPIVELRGDVLAKVRVAVVQDSIDAGELRESMQDHSVRHRHVLVRRIRP